jgi:Predicted hydrolase (metallo-beta-lactamase superfamily)
MRSTPSLPGSDGKNDCDLELISAGRNYVLGDSIVSVLSPAANAASEDENDLSAVLLAEYGEYKFLLTGDASATLLETLDLPKIDVLKVAHHGSSDGTSELLLSKTSPAHAFISCGAGNEYGHPQDACLRWLTEAGARVWRTDLSGNVVAAVTGGTLRITTSR